jgi:hypothetical protein
MPHLRAYAGSVWDFIAPPPVNGGEIEAYVNFTGLVVSPVGTVALVLNGTQQASTTVAAFSGFSTSVFYTLNYSFDMVTGSITSATFNGNDYTGTFNGAATAGVFTGSLTNLFGIYGATAVATAYTSRVDNLSISGTAIPEPATSAVWVALAGGLAAWRRRPARVRRCSAPGTLNV